MHNKKVMTWYHSTKAFPILKLLPIQSLIPKVISIQMDFTCCQKFNRKAGIP